MKKKFKKLDNKTVLHIVHFILIGGIIFLAWQLKADSDNKLMQNFMYGSFLLIFVMFGTLPMLLMPLDKKTKQIRFTKVAGWVLWFVILFFIIG